MILVPEVGGHAPAWSRANKPAKQVDVAAI